MRRVADGGGRGVTVREFVVGQIYNRRRDIHARYGGQMQGGISTPAEYPFVLAFTGASGTRHGYADEMTADGTLRYFGEGQSGDMSLTRGNRAVAYHAADGKDLLLFGTLGAGSVRFPGPFNCAGYRYQNGPDSTGAQRQAIVFDLVPVEHDPADLPIEAPPPTDNLEELRRLAFAAAGPARQTTAGQSPRSYYARSEAIRQYVLARAKGVCECCGQPAPFTTFAGSLYLEPHHIRRLTDGGLDDPRFMGAVCPNCHRAIHHGQDGTRLNDSLQAVVDAKETEWP